MGRLSAQLAALRPASRRTDGPRTGRLWAIDLETTGLDARRDRIIAIGMVPIIDGVIRPGQAYMSLVRPSLADPESIEPRRDPLSRAAQASIEAHHLRPSDVATAPPITEVLPTVLGRLADAEAMIVHHAGLDVAMLRRASRAIGAEWPAPNVIDTIQLIDRARRRLRVAGVRIPYDLRGARASLGLPLHDAHDALADAVAAAELYLALATRG